MPIYLVPHGDGRKVVKHYPLRWRIKAAARYLPLIVGLGLAFGLGYLTGVLYG